MCVREGSVQRVRDGVWLLPGDLVYDLEAEALQREPEAEDYVVGAADPQRAVGLEDAPRLSQPPDVESVVLPEALRANRITMPITLSGGARRGPIRTQSPEVEEQRHRKR